MVEARLMLSTSRVLAQPRSDWDLASKGLKLRRWRHPAKFELYRSGSSGLQLLSRTRALRVGCWGRAKIGVARRRSERITAVGRSTLCGVLAGYLGLRMVIMGPMS